MAIGDLLVEVINPRLLAYAFDFFLGEEGGYEWYTPSVKNIMCPAELNLTCHLMYVIPSITVCTKEPFKSVPEKLNHLV